MMIDGRFDQQFVELFATSLTKDDDRAELLPLWPMVLAAMTGLVLLVSIAAFR